MHRGTVAQLWRYPVKSMGGERLRSTRVDRPERIAVGHTVTIRT